MKRRRSRGMKRRLRGGATFYSRGRGAVGPYGAAPIPPFNYAPAAYADHQALALNGQVFDGPNAVQQAAAANATDPNFSLAMAQSRW